MRAWNKSEVVLNCSIDFLLLFQFDDEEQIKTEIWGTDVKDEIQSRIRFSKLTHCD